MGGGETKFDFDELGEGSKMLKKLFSGFKVIKQHFLIVEGLALCSMIYQILLKYI